MDDILGRHFRYSTNARPEFRELFDSYLVKINKNPIGKRLLVIVKDHLKSLNSRP